jgi:NDP-sugar pyrophosphorylase family protein
MKAMIFAAGIGSRLKELTRDTPKCLMEVGGRTMLERVVERLKGVGVSSIAINVHHHAEKVVSFVEAKRRFDIDVTFSHEPTLLDTGGGLKKVASLFANEDAFLIHNADVISSIDLKALVDLHRSRKAIGTLAVMKRPSSRGLYLSADNHLIGWSEEKSPPPSDGAMYGFCGVSVASRRIFEFMDKDSTFSIIKPYLAAARATNLVWGASVEAEWIDIGSPEQLAAARTRFSSSEKSS